MKMFIMLALFLVLSACSHHHSESSHHHHQFDKKCAYEVSQNHLNVDGQEEISLEHEGDTYYFSSEEKKKMFEEEIENNIKKSKENWLNSQAVRK